MSAEYLYITYYALKFKFAFYLTFFVKRTTRLSVRSLSLLNTAAIPPLPDLKNAGEKSLLYSVFLKPLHSVKIYPFSVSAEKPEL